MNAIEKLEHRALMVAVASLMNGIEPEWNTLGLRRATRNEIAQMATELRGTTGLSRRYEHNEHVAEPFRGIINSLAP